MYNKREFKLVNIDNGTEILLDGTGLYNEPRNAENSDPTYKRSTKNFSTTTTMSKDLVFTGEGAAFLIAANVSKGVEARVSMTEYRPNPLTDVMEQYINAVEFDFSNFLFENNTVKMPFLSGGLRALLKAKQSTKFELGRSESINGIALPELVKSDFAVVNKPIHLESLMETGSDEGFSDVFDMQNDSKYRYGVLPMTTEVTYESDDSFIAVSPDQFKEISFTYAISHIIQDNPFTDIRSTLFYYNSDVDKTINLKIKQKIRIKKRSTRDLTDKHLSLRLVTMDGGENPSLDMGTIDINSVESGDFFPEFPFFTTLIQMNETVKGDSEYTYYELDFNNDIDLLKGQSLGLYLFGGGNFYENIFQGDAYLRLNAEAQDLSIEINEDSLRSDLSRGAKCVLMNDAGKALTGILTGDSSQYKSEYLESGDFKLSAITSGKLIRGFVDEPITTSLKHYFDNCSALFNMAYNIEVIAGKETIVHEPLRHFFRTETVIYLPNQVNKVKRTVAKEFIYSSIVSGFKKPSGDNLYEELSTDDEYNISTEYTTPITRVVSEYNMESPYRADSVGKELALRQSIEVNPTGDYRADKTIFNLDLKDVGTGIYAERIWRDDLEEAPKNVYNPDSSTGLRFTPFRNMRRHSWFLRGAFTKFSDKYIRFASSIGNSNLITKEVGKAEIKEGDDFIINSLENPIFASEWLEFEYPLDHAILKLINGTTSVNGRDIPNTYFKICFINDFNKKEYGYLFNLKPKKEGKWKLLKAL